MMIILRQSSSGGGWGGGGGGGGTQTIWFTTKQIVWYAEAQVQTNTYL